MRSGADGCTILSGAGALQKGNGKGLPLQMLWELGCARLKELPLPDGGWLDQVSVDWTLTLVRGDGNNILAYKEFSVKHVYRVVDNKVKIWFQTNKKVSEFDTVGKGYYFQADVKAESI